MSDFTRGTLSEHARIAPNWGCFVALGVVLLALGAFALIDAAFVTLASVVFIGAMLVVGGIIQIAHAFANRDWASFVFGLLCGALYVLGGLLLMSEPLRGSLVITLFLAAALIVGGVLRIAIALAHREVAGWPLLFFGGLVGVAVAIVILLSLPWSGLWLLGLLIGIELVFQGAAWIRVGLALRDMP